MLRVIPSDERNVERGYDFRLGDVQKKLEMTHYYGSLTIVFQDGQIVLLREERTLKPGQFDRFI